MKEKYLKKETESQYEYGIRLLLLKVELKPDDLPWEEIVRLLGLECHPDSLRKAFNTTEFGGYSIYRYMSNKALENNPDVIKEEMDNINEKIVELKKERAKLSSEKLEYNRWLREDARDELIADKIHDAIKDYDHSERPPKIAQIGSDKKQERSGILAFGDEHFGTSFTIHGLNGEVLNEYSPDIFYDRMDKLLSKTIEIVKKENLSILNIMSLGDFCDGILRVSQLFKLRYGVVESTVMYATFISEWLNKLSNYVRINYYMTSGNHSELRMLGQPKGTFKDDNMSKVVAEMVKSKLNGNPNFTFIENKTGLIYFEAAGYKILGTHGDIKNMATSLKDLTNTYNTPIDYIIGAHVHHKKNEAVGIDKEIISVPSIMGIDDYSVQLNKTSNAGAGLYIFEKDNGLALQYNIKLNN